MTKDLINHNMPPLVMLSDKRLKPWHTFGLEAKAQAIYLIETVEQLRLFYTDTAYQLIPKLILGEGSNVIFCDDFEGIILINRIKGIQLLQSTEEDVILSVGAGENWHALVQYCLEHHFYGLENLALIPGCAGTAPVQNIGAYGVEFKEVCSFVRIVDLKTNCIKELNAQDCQFGYRDSIFKHQFKEQAVIIEIGLKLKKKWQPNLNYNGLNHLDSTSSSANDLFHTICEIRAQKLPDPKRHGNAGSFFKNPIISSIQLEQLKEKYPSIPHYSIDGTSDYKIAAGWLIDQAGLKGKQIGGAKVHEKQSLVLINQHNATIQDLMQLAHYVIEHVDTLFHITLEPEVRFIGKTGEILFADQWIAMQKRIEEAPKEKEKEKEKG